MPDTEKISSTLTRRQAVGVAGAASAALVLAQVRGPHGLLRALGATDDAQAATTSCVLTPDKVEGPYSIDELLNRSDIRVDPSDSSVQPGVPLALTIVVVNAAGSCAPLAGAVVDVWHANAGGLYSDEAANGTTGKKYLRGLQVTDANGKVNFTTVFPGWYSGRAVHLHFKIRLFDGTSKTYEFTSQLFFDPTLTNQVIATGPYSGRGAPDTTNANDGIYGTNGAQLIVPLISNGSGGYAGTFVVGLSGLPAGAGGGGGTADTVQASLSRVKFRRTAAGKRLLRVTTTAQETVTVKARLARTGTTLVSKTATGLAAGQHTLSLRVPRATSRGRARLTVTFTDSAGATKAAHRTLHVPRRLT